MEVSESSNSAWRDVRQFEELWDILRGAGDGGQGKGFAVRRANQSVGPIRFLKLLKDQSNPERRGRMFREAAALATYRHPRIPSLIESNAHLHLDRSAKLYLVTEFIEGKLLAERGAMPFADAVQVFMQLCDIVEYCHTRGGLHRDIKPDNVILRNGAADAVLVDFGLTFNSSEEAHFSTGDWEELGNRFLRLPELSSYGLAKRDARSDVAFLTGILFFCLFGKVPAVLEDEAGRLPHQRDGIDLARVCPDSQRIQMLAAIFDRGFRPRIMERFQHATALKQEGARLLNQDINPNESDPDKLARELRERFSTEASERQRQRKATLMQGVKWVEDILSEVAASLQQEFIPISSGFYDPNTDHPWKNMGLHHHYREHHMRFWMRTNFVFVGAEFLVTVQVAKDFDEEILRTDAEQPNFAVGNKGKLKVRLLKGIGEIMK